MKKSIYHLMFFAILPLIFMACQGQNDKNESARQPISITDTAHSTDHYIDKQSFTRTKTSVGQTVYIPIYSHIHHNKQRQNFNLTATLSIRNTDPFRSITLKNVLYYDSKGKLISNYLPEPIELKPLASAAYVVEEKDVRGGVGANFIVRWHSNNSVAPPVMESVMISTSGQQGISYITPGRVLEEANPN